MNMYEKEDKVNAGKNKVVIFERVEVVDFYYTLYVEQ